MHHDVEPPKARSVVRRGLSSRSGGNAPIAGWGDFAVRLRTQLFAMYFAEGMRCYYKLRLSQQWRVLMTRRQSNIRYSALISLLLIFLTGLPAHASSITYQVNEDFGSGNSLLGTITTNGSIGPLATPDVTGWSFTATGVTNFSISGAAIFNYSGMALSATADDLLFDFGGQNSVLQFREYIGIDEYYEVELHTLNGLTNFGFSHHIVDIWIMSPMNQRVGVTIIGQQIPTPSTFLLVVLGLSLLRVRSRV